MALTDIFSKRLKKQLGEFPDVYTYDNFPQKLRTQFKQIIYDVIGSQLPQNERYTNGNMPERIYSSVYNILLREYGVEKLTDSNTFKEKQELWLFFKETPKIEECLDLVELLCIEIDNFIRINQDTYSTFTNSRISAEEALEEINQRFKENGVGYQFESGKIIRIDSTFIHSEIVKPVLSLVTGPIFDTVNQEFLSAHEHYRHGKNEEAIVYCLKAFESCMMIICDTNGWKYAKNTTANGLIQLLFEKKLIPDYLDAQFNSLKGILSSGVSTLRNKNGGHGQGSIKKAVPEYMVRYTLNLTGSSIIFLIELQNKFIQENK